MNKFQVSWHAGGLMLLVHSKPGQISMPKIPDLFHQVLVTSRLSHWTGLVGRCWQVQVTLTRWVDLEWVEQIADGAGLVTVFVYVNPWDFRIQESESTRILDAPIEDSMLRWLSTLTSTAPTRAFFEIPGTTKSFALPCPFVEQSRCGDGVRAWIANFGDDLPAENSKLIKIETLGALYAYSMEVYYGLFQPQILISVRQHTRSTLHTWWSIANIE